MALVDRLSVVSLADAQAMDTQLRMFAAAHTRVQRFVGQGLDRLYRMDGLLKLGYASQRDYVRECLGISVREAQELANIERRLVHYPRTETYWQAGLINRCHVREILARVQPDGDMAWAGLAAGMTVRELRAHLLDEESRGQRLATMPDEKNEGRYIHFEASQFLRDNVALARNIANRNFGTELGDAGWLDVCSMELRSTVSDDVFRRAEKHGPEVSKEWLDHVRAEIQRLQEAREKAREKATNRWANLSTDGPDLIIPELVLAPGASVFDIHAQLQDAMRFDRGMEACLVQLLERAHREGVPAALGFDGLEHYGCQRLGISKSLVWSLVALGRALRHHPAVAEVLASGALSKSSATQVVLVATAPTVDEWIDYGRRTTVRHLRRTVEVALEMRREDPNTYANLLPPAGKVLTSVKAIALRDAMLERVRPTADDKPVEEVVLETSPEQPTEAQEHVPGLQTCAPGFSQTAERQSAIGGAAEAIVGLQTCASPQLVGASLRASLGELQTCAQPGGGAPTIPRVPDVPHIERKVDKVRLRVWVPDDLQDFLDESFLLCRTWLELPLSTGECIELMVAVLLQEYREEAETAAREHPVVERDEWRCTVPTCTQMSCLHVHHTDFRSQGGALTPANETSMCAPHHLKCLHEGYMAAKGEAPDQLAWVLGIQPDGTPTQIYEGNTRIFPEPV